MTSYVKFLKKRSSPFNLLPVNKYKKCVEVYQQGYGITSSEKPYISTSGLSSCIAIVGYCKETNTAFIIHADTHSLIHNNIGNVYYQLNKKLSQSESESESEPQSETPKTFDMYLFGGNFGESSEESAEQIKQEFNKFNRFWRNKIKIIFHTSFINRKITNICINSNNGKFYNIEPMNCILCKNKSFMKSFEMQCILNANNNYKSIILYN